MPRAIIIHAALGTEIGQCAGKSAATVTAARDDQSARDCSGNEVTRALSQSFFCLARVYGCPMGRGSLTVRPAAADTREFEQDCGCECGCDCICNCDAGPAQLYCRREARPSRKMKFEKMGL